MTKEQYLENPCRTLSVPYYKKDISMNVVVVHDELIHEQDTTKYNNHQRFFRIKHDLNNTQPLRQLTSRTVREDEMELVNSIIHQCYDGMKVDAEYFRKKRNEPVFYESLWRFILKGDMIVALGICDYDSEVQEVVLDWVQVLPSFQGQGIGKQLVYDLLSHVPRESRFATVSGDFDNPHSPEMLYRSCGFYGEDLWHILWK